MFGDESRCESKNLVCAGVIQRDNYLPRRPIDNAAFRSIEGSPRGHGRSLCLRTDSLKMEATKLDGVRAGLLFVER